MSNHIEPQQNGPSLFGSIKLTRPDGIEYWLARDLQPLMACSAWQKFETPLERAIATAKNQGMDVENLFNRSVNEWNGRGLVMVVTPCRSQGVATTTRIQGSFSDT